MITRFDDYLVHQTSEPIAHPAPSDRNFYDRYWLNGFDREGGFVFEVGFGVYPNRKVMDGHLSVSQDGVQHCFHGSRRAPLDRSESRVGPLRIEVLEPLRRVRITLAPNETGLECDLVFHARSAAHQEPKNFMQDELRVIMDNSRFTQMGAWEGWLRIGGRKLDLVAARTPGTRDRSWGVRPVGEPEAGAPGLLTSEPGVYWVWAPIHWDGFATHFGTFEDREGRPTQLSAHRVPLYADAQAIPAGEDARTEAFVSARHEIEWHRGTRLAARAALHLESARGETLDIELEPLVRFHMLAIGYQHPEWGHGFWKGEQAIAGESWKLDALDLLDFKHVHTHQICRARSSGREGIGTLETICFGRHAPSGFRGILDGAP